MQRRLLALTAIALTSLPGPLPAQEIAGSSLPQELLQLLGKSQGSPNVQPLIAQVLQLLQPELTRTSTPNSEAAILSLLNEQFLRPCLSTLLTPASSGTTRCGLSASSTAGRSPGQTLPLQALLNSLLPVLQTTPGLSNLSPSPLRPLPGSSLRTPPANSRTLGSRPSPPLPPPGVPEPTLRPIPIPVRPAL